MTYKENQDRRDSVIDRLSQYFKIYELVGKGTYNRFKEDSWQFFDTDTLECLLIIREGIGESCTINNWYWGGNFTQRGLRTNIQQIFRKAFSRNSLYLSGHVLGKAFDMHFEKTSSSDVRQWIIANEHLFPCKLRLEVLYKGKEISWVHFDTKNLKRNDKIYQFNV